MFLLLWIQEKRTRLNMITNIFGLIHVRCSRPTFWQLPVADVLQVRPGVFTHVLGGGDGTLFQLQLSPGDLGTLSRRDAAGHRASHLRFAPPAKSDLEEHLPRTENLHWSPMQACQ